MKMKLLKVSLMAALVSSLSLTANAANLVDIEGSVMVNRLGNMVPATNNMELKQGDIVSVYEGSARLSTCSKKIEMNQAVQISNEQACPAAKSLMSEFATGDKVTLTVAPAAAAGASIGVSSTAILAAAAAAVAIGVAASNNGNTPVSP